MVHHVQIAATFFSETRIARVESAARQLKFHFTAFSDANDLLVALGRCPPDVILMELHADSTRSLMLQHSLRQACDPAAIVYLADQATPSAVVAAMEMGAVRILRADCPVEEIEKTLRDAAELSAARSQWMSRIRDARQRICQLSPRQFELLQHMLIGHTNREIGRHLNLSPKTVEKHRVAIRHKTATSWLVDLDRLYAIANRPLTAAYHLNIREMLAFHSEFADPNIQSGSPCETLTQKDPPVFSVGRLPEWLTLAVENAS